MAVRSRNGHVSDETFEFITDNFDRSRTTTNIIDQTVNSTTSLFSTLGDIAPTALSDPHIGLLKYIVAYIKSRGIPQDSILEKINRLDVALSFRMSGFVDQQQQKFLLDSKSPSATTSSASASLEIGSATCRPSWTSLSRTR